VALRDRLSTSQALGNEEYLWLQFTEEKHLLASERTAHSYVYFSVHVIVPEGLNGAKKENTGSTYQWNNIVFNDEYRYCLWAHEVTEE
jgi:hypothetical protein